MPVVERVKDSVDFGFPLRLTRRKGRRVSSKSSVAPSIRVKCGCCEESVVIFYDVEPTGNAHYDTLEINGVHGTVDQWRKVLLPLLEMRSLPGFSRI